MHLSSPPTTPSYTAPPTGGVPSTLIDSASSSRSIIPVPATTLDSHFSNHLAPTSAQDRLGWPDSKMDQDLSLLTLTIGTKKEEISINNISDGMKSLATEPASVNDGSHEQNPEEADETSLFPVLPKEAIAGVLREDLRKRLRNLAAEAKKLSPEQLLQEKKNLHNDLTDLLKDEKDSVQEFGGLEEIENAILPRDPQSSNTFSLPKIMEEIAIQEAERCSNEQNAHEERLLKRMNMKKSETWGVVALVGGLCLCLLVGAKWEKCKEIGQGLYTGSWKAIEGGHRRIKQLYGA